MAHCPQVPPSCVVVAVSEWPLLFGIPENSRDSSSSYPRRVTWLLEILLATLCGIPGLSNGFPKTTWVLSPSTGGGLWTRTFAPLRAWKKSMWMSPCRARSAGIPPSSATRKRELRGDVLGFCFWFWFYISLCWQLKHGLGKLFGFRMFRVLVLLLVFFSLNT